MHSLVRRYIKTAIIFLGLGLGLGFWLLLRRELYASAGNDYLVSAHTHAILLGFVMFLILGVALWLFPRPSRDDRRYKPEFVGAAYWVLLVSTVVRLVAEVGRGLGAPSWLAWPIVAAGAGQLAGFGLYFWTMWGRIRPVGSQLREARGERF
jgi:heme/copper-type cytochrome/quinol oxidase subunit 1